MFKKKSKVRASCTETRCIQSPKKEESHDWKIVASFPGIQRSGDGKEFKQPALHLVRCATCKALKSSLEYASEGFSIAIGRKIDVWTNKTLWFEAPE